MRPQITEIIPEEKYMETSLHGLVKLLSQPDHEPTEQEVANLVIKYFWSYCDPSQRPASLSEITSLMHIYEYYFAHLRFMAMGAKFDFAQLPEFVFPIFAFAKDHGYPVSMLGDVSSTTALVRSLIMHNLDDARGQKSFQGLDIWSGTWILALAQYILAKRKWFQDVHIDWLEQNVPVARHSRNVLRRIIQGNVFDVHGTDATRSHSYKKMSHKPDFVSIEMLPQPGSDLIFEARDESGKTKHHDPFLPTVRTLVEKYSRWVQFHIFPFSLRAHITSEGGESWFCNLPMLWGRSVFELCSVDFHEAMKLFPHISIYGAQLTPSSDMVNLDDVGAHMHRTPDNPDGWIKFSSLWIHRWKKMIQHNPRYNNDLSMYHVVPKEERERTIMPILNWSDTVTP